MGWSWVGTFAHAHNYAQPTKMQTCHYRTIVSGITSAESMVPIHLHQLITLADQVAFVILTVGSVKMQEDVHSHTVEAKQDMSGGVSLIDK